MTTKKDFEATARILKDQRGMARALGQIAMLDNICIEFAALYGKDNPQFKRDRFLAACGMTA
jgi:hypothetical protein